MAPTPRRAVNFLHLVETNARSAPLSANDITRPAWQSTLFAAEHPSLLVFVNFEGVTEADFLALLTTGRPRYVIDIRRVPRFDVGTLNRKLVFSLFSQISAHYIDLSGQLRITSERDARLNPALLASHLQASVFRTNKGVQGPVAFLVDPLQSEEEFLRLLAEALPPFDGGGWDVLRIPHVTGHLRSKDRSRDVVFLSHANPQDNFFASWLATHLANAGYTVWSDVTKLVGGEEFWETIEEIIRNRAAKVIVVLSHCAQTKTGVLDEINLAVSLERALNLERFVIPIRIDDLSFGDVRANLARKNIIDFKANWATGLSYVLKVLADDQVPQTNSRGPSMVSDWFMRHQEGQGISKTHERLSSNWLPIDALPTDLLMYELSVERSKVIEVAKSLCVPWFPYLRLIGTFAEQAYVQQEFGGSVSAVIRCRIPLDTFLRGKCDELPGLAARDAHRFVTSMLRQAWNGAAKEAGLVGYENSSGAIVWYLPRGLIDGNRVTYTDGVGKVRRKLLVGWSDRRQVYWHFGVEAKPVMGRVPRFVLRSHVIFTTDGQTPLSSKERMHGLRRRFCKSWWNDRWRDLLVAYVNWLSKGNDRIELRCGEQSAIRVGSSFIQMLAPVSVEPEILDAVEFSDDIDSEDPSDVYDWDEEDDLIGSEGDDVPDLSPSA